MNRLIQLLAASGMLFAAPYHQRQERPEVPENLKAPADEQVILAAHATGVQIYVCQAGAEQKFGWVLKAPEAELADSTGKQVVHHSAGPTWKHVDGSEVKGKVLAKQDAPKGDAIPWLLLAAASHTGEGVLSRVTSIQRIHTEGGLAPAANTCDGSASGKESRSAYAADYYFYAPGHGRAGVAPPAILLEGPGLGET
jgi:hypothetical protein